MGDERGFRASTDQMLAMLERLMALEREKQHHTVGSDEFVESAREAERLSRLTFRWAGMQLQLAEASPRAVARGEMAPTRLADVEPRPLDRVLANWRQAQLRFELAAPGSPEAAAAADEVERLREEFRALQELKFASDGAR